MLSFKTRIQAQLSQSDRAALLSQLKPCHLLRKCTENRTRKAYSRRIIFKVIQSHRKSRYSITGKLLPVSVLLLFRDIATFAVCMTAMWPWEVLIFDKTVNNTDYVYALRCMRKHMVVNGALVQKFLRKVSNKQTDKQRRKHILLGGGKKIQNDINSIGADSIGAMGIFAPSTSQGTGARV